MTQEEKELLFKDLCTRLPYGVKVHSDGIPHEQTLIGFIPDIEHYNIKPYFRPMSSMTEEELTECRETCKYRQVGQSVLDCATCETFDWLNSHHFDYRGLIEKGLALEAPENMYKTK